jgi:threonine/homoserine/homoserine lactone efflux protein
MGLNAVAALFFSHPPVMRAFQRASFASSILFGLLFTGLGLLVAWDLVTKYL